MRRACERAEATDCGHHEEEERGQRLHDGLAYAQRRIQDAAVYLAAGGTPAGVRQIAHPDGVRAITLQRDLRALTLGCRKFP